MKLGLLLPNQGVVFGATTVPELLELAGIGRPSVTPHYIRLILLSSLDEYPAVVFG